MEIWRRLLGLESHDIVQRWFKRIHGRELNARGAREINAAARQAREYFGNARRSDYSVRPLLTFYGVASLGRALLLLMKRSGGEADLRSGHGLQSVCWRNVMGGEIAQGLQNLGDLTIRKRQGLFSDFLVHAKNATLIHWRTASVNGRWEYGEQGDAVEVTLGDLFSRIPDLGSGFARVAPLQYANVTDFSNSEEKGLMLDLGGEWASTVAAAYGNLGYSVKNDGERSTIACDSDKALGEPPMFVHTYVHKMAGAIPVLKLAVPFREGVRLSQLGMTHMMSYALGMLVRYYPTNWIALINGSKGDLLWPTINRAQDYVESAFPELVAEYVRFATDNPEWVRHADGQ